jgi:hypothetical protein
MGRDIFFSIILFQLNNDDRLFENILEGSKKIPGQRIMSRALSVLFFLAEVDEGQVKLGNG